MYHPVLLPKRNKFGFLRGPKPSLNINESPTEKTSTSYEHLPKIKQTNYNETNRYITNSIKPIRYKLDELNVSYELKTTSWQNNQDSYRLSSRKTTTTPPETAESWPPDLSTHLEQKQAYVPRRGSNVQNLKNHHFLNVISYHKNNANNNVNNHYLNHHNCGKSSSNKCLVCRFVLADNSNNSNTNSGTNNTRRKLSNKTTMMKINKTSSNESTSNENNFNISDLDDVNSSNNETSSVKKWSDEMAFNSKEKISYYQPNEGTNRPRIKLNLWL
jgi:hypothetical protein